jgi:hypothetical protein
VRGFGRGVIPPQALQMLWKAAAKDDGRPQASISLAPWPTALQWWWSWWLLCDMHSSTTLFLEGRLAPSNLEQARLVPKRAWPSSTGRASPAD